MTESRTKHAIKNTIWGTVSKIVSLVMPFLIRTLLIKILGMEYLGLGSLFSSILSVLNMADLGFSSAIVFCLYKPIAEGDLETQGAYLNIIKKIYNLIAFSIFSIGLCVMPFLGNLIKEGVPQDIELFSLYLIYLISSSVTYAFSAYRICLLIGNQRNDVVNKVQTISHMLMYSFQVLAIVLVRNYYFYIIFLPVFNLLNNFLTAFISKRMYPQVICKGYLSKEKTMDLKKRVFGLALLKISYVTRNAFDSIVLSAMLGLVTVAIYNNYYYIFTAISAFLIIFLNSITASLGNSIVVDDVSKTEKDFHIICFLYMFISCICYCCFISLYQPFMMIWVGEDKTLPDYAMILFSIYFLVERSENILSTYYDACGLWWNGKWKGIVESALNLALNIILCYFFGVTGIIVATIISVCLISVPITSFYLHKHYFKQKNLLFLMEYFLLLVLFISIGLGVYYLTIYIPATGTIFMRIVYMAIRCIIAIIIPCGVIAIISLKSKSVKMSFLWLFQHIGLFKNRC